MTMTPPNFLFNPENYITIRKAAKRLSVDKMRIHRWIYNYVFKDLAFVDGTLYLNKLEIDRLKEFIEENKVTPIPTNLTNVKKQTKPISYKGNHDPDLSIEPELNFFIGGKNQHRDLTQTRKVPISQNYSSFDKYIEEIRKNLEDLNKNSNLNKDFKE